MRYLIVLLAIIGVVISSLALQVHYSTGTQPCSINEKWDCGIVNHSSYAVMFHVPVAALGIGGYLLLALLSFLRRRALLLIAALIELTFALYLSHIEKDILQVWCLYCVISQGIIALLALLSLAWFAAARISRRRATTAGA